MIIKIRVGSLALTEARDESLPQEFTACYLTVRIAPGTYDVFAYLDQGAATYHDQGVVTCRDQGAATYRLRQLSAECLGSTIRHFRARSCGGWGNNHSEDQPVTAHVGLPIFGLVATQPPTLLAQATLCDALVRLEWDPCEVNPRLPPGKMWRFIWNQERKLVVIQRPRYGGGLSLAAFEDHRRFCVDAVEMAPNAVSGLGIMFQHLHSVDQLTIGETAVGWSHDLERLREVKRLA